ncbi:MAG TPA: hypothetical protein PLC98_05200 [Anaerolineales bacterium]|nr:hypothetical protein [Anaerolineales bacterium]
MGAEYRLVLYDTAGVKQADVVNFMKVAYTKRVNRAGLAKFQLPAGHPLISQIQDKWLLEVWRRDASLALDWYVDWGGIYREQARASKRIDEFTGTAVGYLEQLAWRHVLWPAGRSGRSVFSAAKAETIAKALVTYNATAAATVANGRWTDGAWSDRTITVQADAAGGETLSLRCHGDNLLETLASICQVGVGGGDYDLIRTGPTAYEFRWYLGQRGADRRGSVLFATEHGNMAEPTYTESRISERTVAVAAGKGEEEERRTRTRTGANWSTSNDTETFVDDKSADSDAELDVSADKRLAERRASIDYGFKILQTRSTAYGVHYCVGGVMGDLVGARYWGIEEDQKIDQVAVEYSGRGSEKIDVEMVNV